jgi:transcriptional regulator with XRE-family HTH domain
MDPIKDIVRTHRRASCLSRAELARLAGVGKTVVFELEHGKETVRYNTLTKILSALNITIVFQSPLLEQARAETRPEAEGKPS